ncbi:P-loop containing nucleoside triphosphate hydrolase protein [Gonapodya prolifera JEL478]|uniref:p-loop containing nucleoside triphosphate hydrolase protein n=1 Tax=Gonapodya prolifera (strain JEL478) TaxID=1344416 RepID=A0A139AVG7_GONPJ|nr:P-loop containing nucleoside triphosphate hydrolase protein [Gonapodya prolifera JEL478]|eukprot:KXS20732.1 P-loop containing nucleoside triphosphate hydrolase protein [Gonapodya prolifera JEL478]
MGDRSQSAERPADVKIILLGDSAVGKSKLIERFLLSNYSPQQHSTYALTLYRHTVPHPADSSRQLTVEWWDTAGQERFQALHPSYYHRAHACLLVFDLTRKVTYKNLEAWYSELTKYRSDKIPVVVVANKVDAEPDRAQKSFAFVDRRKRCRDEDLPLFCVSASDGTNVVAAFQEAIRRAVNFKESSSSISCLPRTSSSQPRSTVQPESNQADFVDEVLRFIEEEEQRPDGIFRGAGTKDEDWDKEDASRAGMAVPVAKGWREGSVGAG